MRETCLFCVCKHLAQAQVLFIESKMGYPLHLWLAVGHLAEAEAESLDEHPDLSECIRQTRLAISGQEGNANKYPIMACLEKADKQFQLFIKRRSK